MTLPTPIQPGIYFDVPDAEYRQAPGVSQTALKNMDRSIAHYEEANRNPEAPTRPMRIGHISHSLLLTPNAPQDWAVAPPGHDGRTKAGQAWAKANQGKLHISDKERRTIQGAVAAAKAHPILSLAMDGAAYEVSIFSAFAGIMIKKGRLDITTSGPAISDCKFVEDAREYEFAGLAAAMGYYIQAAFYIDLYNENLPHGEEPKTKFCFFAIEKNPPYAINVFDLHPDDIRRGRATYLRYLDALAGSVATGDNSPYHNGSAYSRSMKTLSLPYNVRKRIDETILC